MLLVSLANATSTYPLYHPMHHASLDGAFREVKLSRRDQPTEYQRGGQ